MMNTESLEQLADRIRRQIPITKHLDFSFALENGLLVTCASLASNVNHRGTAFGGSLSMLFTLTGWARTALMLQDLGLEAQIVVQDVYVDYNLPVEHDIRIRCLDPGELAARKVHFMLTRWGKARLTIRCAVEEDGQELVSFKGRYVALAEGTPE